MDVHDRRFYGMGHGVRALALLTSKTGGATMTGAW
jgi:hypothetical protein